MEGVEGGGRLMSRPLTLEDLELFYSGAGGHPFMLYGDLLDIMKGAGTVETGLGTAYCNRVYGALLWANLNQEANFFGMVPKVTWVKSGWRVKTGFAESTLSNITISETGALPAPVYPEVATLSTTPKVMAEQFEVSDVLEALASQGADDIWGQAHQVRVEIGTEFVKHLNQLFLARVTAAQGANEPTSLDRIVSVPGEFGANGAWANVYGIDKSTNAWANPYVDYDTTALRPLTDDMIRKAIQGARKNGGNPNAILTGYDTYAAIQGLYTTFVRYNVLGQSFVQFGINGIQTAEGIGAGIQVATLYGLPVVQSVDTPNGGQAGEIDYIYFLDMTDTEGYGIPRLAMSVLRPVEYFESRDYILLNKFVIRGAYRFVGELIARNIRGQAKIRDITA